MKLVILSTVVFKFASYVATQDRCALYKTSIIVFVAVVLVIKSLMHLVSIENTVLCLIIQLLFTLFNIKP